jgi:cytochrome c-type biogenesis protein CcmF
MFALAAFVLTVVGQDLWRGVGARRAMAGEGPARALVALVRRNRRRYGGYTVHAGMAVLFVGVAASSAFQHARDVQLSPGQTARIDGYDVHYVRATSSISQRAGSVERINFGAVLDVRKDGKYVARLHPERGYYPSGAIVAFGPLGRFFEGESVSEVGMRAGVLRDFWTAVQPDIGSLRPIVDEGDRVFEQAAGKLSPSAESAALGIAITRLVQRYADRPPPATFRLIASPMVAWIWIGGLIVFTGGLIALWPAPDAAARRARAGYAARVARDLGRA